VQLGVHGERGHSNVVHKFLQTRYATQFHRLGQRAVGPQPAVTNTDVYVVMQRTDTANFIRCQLLDGTIFLPTQVKTLRRDLFQMYFHELASKFHWLNFPLSALATQPGTKLETFPPSLAISFTMGELR